MATTRKVLERIPDDKFEWQPHARSMTFGALGSHVAEMVRWLVDTLRTDSFDLNPPGGDGYKPFVAKTNVELLAAFDRNVKDGREALASTSDEKMVQVWSLLSGGKTIFAMPRVASIRGMLLNHIVHHRGQLSVYLRLNDIPVPAMYGPSADEGTSAMAG